MQPHVSLVTLHFQIILKSQLHNSKLLIIAHYLRLRLNKIDKRQNKKIKYSINYDKGDLKEFRFYFVT